MTKKSETPKPAGQAQTQSGQLMIQKVYTKDLSFETPHSPQIFSEDWKPTVNLQLANHATTHGNDLYEVVLTVTVTVTFAEKTVYLAEVNQAGIFQVSGFPENLKARVLATMCPNILYPFWMGVSSSPRMAGSGLALSCRLLPAHQPAVAAPASNSPTSHQGSSLVFLCLGCTGRAGGR